MNLVRNAAKFAGSIAICVVAVCGCTKSDPSPPDASLTADSSSFPVLLPADWKPVIEEVVAADPNYPTGVLRTSTKYMDLATGAIEANHTDQSRRFWTFGHLLAWYSAELLANAGLPASTIADQRKSLLDNRVAEVQGANLTIETLRASFDAMNSQLELVGRPKCRSLSAQSSPEPSPRTQREEDTAKVWQRFDRLRGPQFRTSAMLRAHLLQAEQIAANLPDDEAKPLHDFNGREYRRRLPALYVVGEEGRADGEDFRTIVPSEDAKRCVSLGTAWIKGPQASELAAAGFQSMRCADGQNWLLKTN